MYEKNQEKANYSPRYRCVAIKKQHSSIIADCQKAGIAFTSVPSFQNKDRRNKISVFFC